MADRRKLGTIWRAMKSRCFNPKNDSYSRYGGRGIGVSKEWISFENFLRDMGDSYKSGLSLERINNRKDYCKENCKWSSKKEQANNRRNNRLITFNGVRKNLTQWAEYLGIKGSTLRQRYYVYKWNIERCLTT